MQSHPSKRLYRCFLSFLLLYALLLLCVSPGSPALASRARKAPSSRGSSFLVPLQQNAPLHRTGEILVRFRGKSSEQDKAVAIASQGARRKRQLRGESAIEELELTSGQDPETAAQQLRLNSAVEFAEPNFLINHNEPRPESEVPPKLTSEPQPFFEPTRLNSQLSLSNPGMTAMPQLQGNQPNDPRFAEEWALRNTGQSGGQFGSDIGATVAWQRSTGSASTVIAVIDSGIDFTHPDLANNKWTNRAPSSDGDLNGWDYITNTGAIRDEQGHGTAIAGIIAAQGNNEVGISG